MMKQPDMNEAPRDDYDFEDFEDTTELSLQQQNAERLMKCPSIAYFEAVCSFWRTFYWLSESNLLPNLKPNVSTMLQKFVKFENQRLKNVCSDVGAMLASFTVFQKSICTENVNNCDFLDAYLDEVFLRCLM